MGGRSYGPIGLRAVLLLGAAAISRHFADPRRAIGFVVLAVVLTVACLAFPAFSRLLDRAGLAVGRVVAAVFFAVAIALVDFLVNVPGRALVRLGGRDAVSGLKRGGDGTAWRDLSSTPSVPTLPFATDLPSLPDSRSGEPTIVGRVRGVLALTCVFLVLNTLLGSVYSGIAPRPWTAETYYSRALLLNPTDVPSGGRAPSAAAGVRSEAMGPYPWRGQLRSEYASLVYHFEPYVTIAVADHAGRLVNVKDGIRRSWKPPREAGKVLPIVWFLGGSTMFGEDQRDLYTIPSMVARKAAAEGHPIDVVNLGTQGFTNFQAVLAFERALDSLPTPDAVVFYDGANDLQVQTKHPSDQPTHLPYKISNLVDRPSLYERWRSSSLVHEWWDRAFGSQPAGADTRPPDAATIARNTVSVYSRGLALARPLAARHGVTVLPFWQPTRAGTGGRQVDLARAELPPGVIDVSDALDGVDPDLVYVDAVHTNERGARIVADRLWTSIEMVV